MRKTTFPGRTSQNWLHASTWARWGTHVWARRLRVAWGPSLLSPRALAALCKTLLKDPSLLGAAHSIEHLISSDWLHCWLN